MTEKESSPNPSRASLSNQLEFSGASAMACGRSRCGRAPIWVEIVTNKSVRLENCGSSGKICVRGSCRQVTALMEPRGVVDGATPSAELSCTFLNSEVTGRTKDSRVLLRPKTTRIRLRAEVPVVSGGDNISFRSKNKQ